MDRGSFLIWVGVILALIAVAVFTYPAIKRAVVSPSPQSEAEALISETESVDLGDLDAEFEVIDRELNNL